jgi:sulfur-carrier protein
MNISIRYFALFREQSGREAEVRTFRSGGGDSVTTGLVYADAADRHGFSLDRSVLRPAVNGRYVRWDTSLSDGDEVVFIPPVSGG